MTITKEDTQAIEIIRCARGEWLDNNRNWVTVSEAAKLLGVSRQRVWQRITAGDIPIYQRAGRVALLERAKIVELTNNIKSTKHYPLTIDKR